MLCILFELTNDFHLRGFGDHDLRAQSQNGSVYIKPFLTPQPEVCLVMAFLVQGCSAVVVNKMVQLR